MGDPPAQGPNPRVEQRDNELLAGRHSWLWLQTLLQREREGGAGHSHQKEKLKGKLKKGEWPEPCRRFSVHQWCPAAGQGEDGEGLEDRPLQEREVSQGAVQSKDAHMP